MNTTRKSRPKKRKIQAVDTVDRVAWKLALGFLAARTKIKTSSLVSLGIGRQSSVWEDGKIFLVPNSLLFPVMSYNNNISYGTLSHSSVFPAVSLWLLGPVTFGNNLGRDLGNGSVRNHENAAFRTLLASLRESRDSMRGIDLGPERQVGFQLTLN